MNNQKDTINAHFSDIFIVNSIYRFAALSSSSFRECSSIERHKFI